MVTATFRAWFDSLEIHGFHTLVSIDPKNHLHDNNFFLKTHLHVKISIQEKNHKITMETKLPEVSKKQGTHLSNKMIHLMLLDDEDRVSVAMVTQQLIIFNCGLVPIATTTTHTHLR